MQDNLNFKQKAFVWYGAIANAASLLSFGIAYFAAPSDMKAGILKVLGLIFAASAVCVYLYLVNLVIHRKESKQNAAEPLLPEHIFISSPGPGLSLSRSRSHADIQLVIFSPAPVELLYIEAIILYGSTELFRIDSSKPASIPKLNPQTQFLTKSLTEKKLQRLTLEPGAFLRIAGTAKFRGPLNENLNTGFSILTAIWELPG